ncbi:MAG: hypothetical protein AMJ73_07085 [candidate division Zixibacteria bacterium SM1_73]|nr:MAG: hypothetical protein AMJ73_07085 [candidate division Zixibacteria bacterium SM1_73]
MRIVMISDTHFGDPMCTLVDHEALMEHQTLKRGKKYNAFFEKAGQNNDYLILLGDIIDFSIVGYANAYKVAKAFFHLIKQDKIAKHVAHRGASDQHYLPGRQGTASKAVPLVGAGIYRRSQGQEKQRVSTARGHRCC